LWISCDLIPSFTLIVAGNRAALNRKAQAILSGSRPVTIRLANSEIALAKQQAEAKGLKYQTYMKMLLHESLHAVAPARGRARRAQRGQQ
jgi:hypothetical protein